MAVQPRMNPLCPTDSPRRAMGMCVSEVVLRNMLSSGFAMCRLSLTPRQMQEALTPGHLKKAKLMFFFTRYPSSTLLKTYFLDVQVKKQQPELVLGRAPMWCSI